jgi:hypothetical protein
VPLIARLGILVLFLAPICSCLAQSPNGTVSGRVLDPDGRAIAGADILVVNDLTGAQAGTKSDDEGIYLVMNLPPGQYRLQVSKVGFKALLKPGIVLNVQDALSINFKLPVGAASIVVTVEGGAPLMNTTDAAVSTVVDRQFAENLPLNGRSFQALIQLTPGVVFTPSTRSDRGQFSVNGQRATSNYWMVDGVSANIGISSGSSPGNGLGGTLGSFSALGGTNSLVSVDAMQEFRIQTSTFAPEFGRTPGGQISIVTRSGTNAFHGTAFDYFRNGVLDANGWFADANKLPKPAEKQNDFGGTFSGRIRKEKTFFFFSYEGLRLRLPETTLTTVPDLAARQAALSALQPYLNAFPLPNGPEDPVNAGAAQFNASYSNPAFLDAYSIRLDHHLGRKIVLFGRYNYSPSQLVSRGGNGNALSTLFPNRITTQTVTAGATWVVSPKVAEDLRFNYSRVNANSYATLDNFGGAVPLASVPVPSPYTSENSVFALGVFSLQQGFINRGQRGRSIQRQVNVVDSVAVQKGSHNLKFGGDFRRLAPIFDSYLYAQYANFVDVPSFESGNLFLGNIYSIRNSILVFRNLGLFAQDTWRLNSKLTLTYGLRWDVDFAPSALSGPSPAAVTGYNLNDLSALALAPMGTPPFETTYRNLAPRMGAAYQVSQNPDWQTVVRGGVGLFYDLVDSELGNLVGNGNYPFGASKFVGPLVGGAASFPLTPSDAAPPQISSHQPNVLAFNPHQQLPYTLQWNVALEQGLGARQTVTATYTGSIGRRLLQSVFVSSPNPGLSSAMLVGDTASSNYNALQIQFQRRLSRGVQALGSYSWSHSIDDASAGSIGNFSNAAVPTLSPNTNRGSSDFDIRNAFSAAVTYEIPAPRSNAFGNVILRGWSLESIVLAHSAPPVDVSYSNLGLFTNVTAAVRPDVVPGQSFYLYGSRYPGGKAINASAFTGIPTDSNGNALRQGDLGRNALRGFRAAQWDLAVHRAFPIHESMKLEVRAEMFNVLNHPNFAPPSGDLQCPGCTNPQFGVSTQTLGQYLAGQNAGGAGFNALYQTGGPRSVQLALKMMF